MRTPEPRPSRRRELTRFVRRATRTVIPHRWRAQLRALVNRATSPLYRGERVWCPVCERRFGRFRTYASEGSGKRYLMCPSCGSLGRHRLDWLFLSRRTNLLHDRLRVLHVAPEPGFSRRLEALETVDYVSADYDSTLASERMDIRDIEYPDASFDAIICNHVLEHVDDDRGALSELARVLRPGGWALLQVPIASSSEVTYDDPTVTSARDRERAFGQYDHVRIYGSDYPQRLADAGFEVEVIAYADEFTPEEVAEMGLDPLEVIHLAHKP